VNLKRFIIH